MTSEHNKPHLWKTLQAHSNNHLRPTHPIAQTHADYTPNADHELIRQHQYGSHSAADAQHKHRKPLAEFESARQRQSASNHIDPNTDGFKYSSLRTKRNSCSKEGQRSENLSEKSISNDFPSEKTRKSLDEQEQSIFMMSLDPKSQSNCELKLMKQHEAIKGNMGALSHEVKIVQAEFQQLGSHIAKEVKVFAEMFEIMIRSLEARGHGIDMSQATPSFGSDRGCHENTDFEEENEKNELDEEDIRFSFNCQQHDRKGLPPPPQLKTAFSDKEEPQMKKKQQPKVFEPETGASMVAKLQEENKELQAEIAEMAFDYEQKMAQADLLIKQKVEMEVESKIAQLSKQRQTDAESLSMRIMELAKEVDQLNKLHFKKDQEIQQKNKQLETLKWQNDQLKQELAAKEHELKWKQDEFFLRTKQASHRDEASHRDGASHKEEASHRDGASPKEQSMLMLREKSPNRDKSRKMSLQEQEIKGLSSCERIETYRGISILERLDTQNHSNNDSIYKNFYDESKNQSFHNSSGALAKNKAAPSGSSLKPPTKTSRRASYSSVFNQHQLKVPTGSISQMKLSEHNRSASNFQQGKFTSRISSNRSAISKNLLDKTGPASSRSRGGDQRIQDLGEKLSKLREELQRQIGHH